MTLKLVPSIRIGVVTVILSALVLNVTAGQRSKPAVRTYALDSLSGIDVNDNRAEVVTYRGRRSIRLVRGPSDNDPIPSLAILKDSDFRDGTIELAVAAVPRPGAPADERGFVGISFRSQPGASRFECIYLRMTNGRCDDQIRRNHSAQYASEPDYPWHRLRKENPGQYESYVDLEPGAWTKMKIVVSGTKAALYVNGASQPCLVVNDLKLGDSRGQIGLWAGSDTEAYFSMLSIT